MFEHSFDNVGGPVAVMQNFSKVVFQVGEQFHFELVIALGLLVFFFEFPDQFGTEFGEVVDEVERVLNFVGDTGG